MTPCLSPMFLFHFSCYTLPVNMKSAVIVCKLIAVFSVCAAAPPKGLRRLVQESVSSLEPEEQWFTQKLDHFNGADSRTWQQVNVCLRRIPGGGSGG